MVLDLVDFIYSAYCHECNDYGHSSVFSCPGGPEESIMHYICIVIGGGSMIGMEHGSFSPSHTRS